MLGEVFHQDEETRLKMAAESHVASTVYHSGEDGARYLEREVFLPFPEPPVRACGCKIFFNHARLDPHMGTAWDALTGDRDTRIILLTRRNLLSTLVSEEIALRTNQWLLRPGEATGRGLSVSPFDLEPGYCHWYFDRLFSSRTWANAAFRGHPVLRLEYETDLDGRFPETMARIFEFLGVAPAPVQPGIRKQRTKSLSKQVANFKTLRSHFKHTLYAEFFEEGRL